MLISIGDYDLNIANKAINLIAKNAYKFPRPNEMNPVRVIIPGSATQREVKEPAIPFDYSITFIYEKCMRFLLERLEVEMIKDPNHRVYELKRTVSLYPWSFVSILHTRPEGEGVTLDQLRKEVLPNKSLWAKFYYLEIPEVTINYRDKSSKRN